jgi:diaminopimelate decarboxylase
MIDNETETQLPYDGTAVSEAGELLLAGHPASQLVHEYGSPLIVLIEEVIRANCREYRQRVDSYPLSRVYYAAKAFLTTGFCRLLAEEGMGLDVVSAGELQTALEAGFPAERILLHGNAKLRPELELALKSRVGRIVIDNDAEIELLAKLTSDLQVEQPVYIRVTPGVEPDTHEYVRTGQIDSKFGFNLAGGAVLAAARRVLEIPSLKLVGLHCHIGSQLLDISPYAGAARMMLEFYATLVNVHGAPLAELNIGGGLGVRYEAASAVPTITTHIKRLTTAVLEICAELDIEPPLLCDEPGRSIIAEAGTTLYTVQSVKRIPGVRNYVSVDGGMTDNPRYALYGARHPMLLANRAQEVGRELWSVSGRCCESGDMLIKDVLLPDPIPGDILAVFATGAYTYSMASSYNRIPRPAVVLVGRDRAGLLARREQVNDLLRLDEIPDWLA